MADAGSWPTVLTTVTTLAAVGVGSFISYVSQYQAWARGNRRDAYGNFIASSTDWSVYMSDLARALKDHYRDQESYWKRVNEARRLALSAYAQLRMLGKDRPCEAAKTIVDLLQDTLNRLDRREIPDMHKVRKEFNTHSDKFLAAARGDISRKPISSVVTRRQRS